MGTAVTGNRALLVELHNHAHLGMAYGEAFAAEAMHSLRERVRLSGGSVTDSDPMRFLATGLPSTSTFDPPRSFDCVGELERWQVELSAMLLASAGQRVRPVVTVDWVRHGDSASKGQGAAYVEKLKCGDVWEPQLAPPRLDWQWRMGYERDMALAVSFDEALMQGRVNLVFQPVARYDHPEEVLYAEGLLRFSGLPRGMGAARLVPVLERLGLIRALDRVVVLAVLERLESSPEARLGCNISAHSVVADRWWRAILDRLAVNPAVATRLTIEITETAPLPDFGIAVAFVRLLKSLGCRIALDDFGAGHSSMAFASLAHPDVIKIDASYLRRSHCSSADTRVFRHLAALAQALAPQVVAEGVENAEDVRVAFEAGVDWLQGWAVVPPAPTRQRVTLHDNRRLEAEA